MAYEHILYSVADGVARISLNDPKTMNGVTEPMGREMVDAFARAAKDARAVLLTGAGKGFCSGATLSAAQALLADPLPDAGGPPHPPFNPVIIAPHPLAPPALPPIPAPPPAPPPAP